jgi:hypothetical protein
MGHLDLLVPAVVVLAGLEPADAGSFLVTAANRTIPVVALSSTEIADIVIWLDAGATQCVSATAPEVVIAAYLRRVLARQA